MQFRKGQNRAVVLLPELGLVVKFPIIYVIPPLKVLTVDVWKYGWKAFTAWNMPMESYSGFRSWLFKGLVANWMEFWLYSTTRNPFLQPTYFSLFGLMNIQRYGSPCTIKYVDLWCQLCELTDEKVWDDGHHFSNPENFTFDGHVLRMLDYGSVTTHKVILQYGNKIVSQFNPSYDWNEVRKKKGKKNAD